MLPLTEQLPVAVKPTARPEDAVALNEKSGLPKVLLTSAAKVIVWPTFCAATDSTTCVAALKLPPPVWSYFTVHVPVPLVIVKVAP